jgi:hypothetical protein
MANYIPGSDSGFDEWVDNFLTYATPRMEAMGFTDADLLDVSTAAPLWKTALNNQIMWKAQAQAATVTKDESRADLEQKIRALVNRLQAGPDVTDADRAGLGITVRGMAVVPVGMPPTQRPTGRANGGQPLKHIVSFENEADAGVSKAKPAGVSGCEIWVKVGDAPTGPSDMSFAKTASRTPAIVEHAEEDAGKMAYYRLRWVNGKGEPGTWSDVFQATIAA